MAARSPNQRGGRPRVDTPNTVDVAVGKRIKEFRTRLGLSQDALAKRVGLTFQQVQKYEKGTNRVAASRLVDFATALAVPVSAFFDESANVPMPENAADRGALALMRAYSRIQAPYLQQLAVTIVASLGKVVT